MKVWAEPSSLCSCLMPMGGSKMRFSKLYFVILAGSLLVGVSVANATTPTVTSTSGTVVAMRGNSVIRLSAGDALRPGDRVIATSGSSASYSNGNTVGSYSSVVVRQNEVQVVSRTSNTSSSSSSGNSESSSSSSLFSTSSSRSSSRREDDNRDRGSRDDDHKGHDHHKPWHGKPRDAKPCSY